MVPYDPETLPDLQNKKILMLSGLMDPIIPADNSTRLADLFKKSGADVTFSLKPTGHGLTQNDYAAIKEWLSMETVL